MFHYWQVFFSVKLIDLLGITNCCTGDYFVPDRTVISHGMIIRIMIKVEIIANSHT